MGLAQNEMKAKPALPERVRSMEGLGRAHPRPLIGGCVLIFFPGFGGTLFACNFVLSVVYVGNTTFLK